MDPELKKLLAALGVNVDDGQQPTDEQMQTAMAALSALKAKADGADAAKQALATLKAQGAGVDLSNYVPAAAYEKLAVENAALKAGGVQDSIENLIEAAHKDGKLCYATEPEDYLIPYGEQKGVAALKSLLEKRPGIAALKTQQTNDTTPPKKEEKSGEVELNEHDLAVLKHTGVDKEAYLKTKKEMLGGQ